ncbi:MAG: TIGR04290 family methyltransferase [Kastovskya adunca ATA6-11-RM4]|jgi:methyltransferase (TIGR04290 family)|nr:TIGR04290 family methyltransferase [Kastovskya adunca ATA6-11-RM4]
MKIIILGLSITSSWGNGHATTYRGLVRELVARGHDVLFLERDVPWYATNRDLPHPPYGRTNLYSNLEELKDSFTQDVREADLVIVGSYVPEGVAVGEWVTATARGVTAFYDIDTPVTLAKLERGDTEYLSPPLISCYNLYLSFTGGATLHRLEQQYGSPMARALYCSVDPTLYAPEEGDRLWNLGYMGTYSDDRQPTLNHLLMEPAHQWGEGRFVVAGPQYPSTIKWSSNIERIEHLPPAEHRTFYNAQHFTLNVTRADMIRAGYSPSVRLFEAAACGTPIISDYWEGLDTFFELGKEILVADSPADVLGYLRQMPEEERRAIGDRARKRVLAEHTSAHRAAELEQYAIAAMAMKSSPKPSFSNHPKDLPSAIANLAPWFHNLHLPDGTQTAPDHFLGDFPAFKWQQLATSLPENLEGWRVLDIGCNAGFYSFELARRGAYVTGIDVDPHYLAQANWALLQLGLEERIEFKQMQVYDLAHTEESFDLILFMGVFYHLRYPLLGLDIVAQKVKRLLVFQTLTLPGEEVYEDTSDRPIHDREALTQPGWPKMAFIEHSFVGDPTNWWIANHAGVEAMLRSSGLRVINRPGHEIYLCQPDPANPSCVQTWNEKEYLAATGKLWHQGGSGDGE